jgi:hypothetical protein
MTIEEFVIGTADPNHYFGHFLAFGLSFGGDLVLERDEVSFFQSICRELGNYELFALLFDNIGANPGGRPWVTSLHFLSGVESIHEFDVSVISSHFYEFSDSSFDNLSPTVLEAILRDDHLVVRSEDSLFDIIHGLASRDSKYFPLVEFVRFEYLSAVSMKTAFEFLSAWFEMLTFKHLVAPWSSTFSCYYSTSDS